MSTTFYKKDTIDHTIYMFFLFGVDHQINARLSDIVISHNVRMISFDNY